MKKLCILGAGPKALAIASKATVLKKLGFSVPEIVIIEKNDVAAHWTGESGFTNGKLPLGTSPEKDLGFPYASFCWRTCNNVLVDRAMMEFSWNSFLIEHHLYSDWVDRGKPAPNHKRWAQYLRWAYEKTKDQIQLIRGELLSAEIVGDKWKLTYDTRGEKAVLEADGFVVTGPGRIRMADELPNDDRVLSVERFWLQSDKYVNVENKHFAVVGTGENAASVAVTLGQVDRNNRIDIISPVAMNYSRGESYVENHVYTDPFQGNWFQLTPENRRDFIYRTDRGVFSVVTKGLLDHMESIEIIPGRLTKVRVDGLEQLLMTVEYNKGQEVRRYDYIIVATGFDHWGMVDSLIPDSTQQEIISRTGVSAFDVNTIENAIDEKLAVTRLQPLLHLPMVSGMAQGPGFANLSCLGRLSDQILSAYVPLE